VAATGLFILGRRWREAKRLQEGVWGAMDEPQEGTE
jgi:hypothetical protein